MNQHKGSQAKVNNLESLLKRRISPVKMEMQMLAVSTRPQSFSYGFYISGSKISPQREMLLVQLLFEREQTEQRLPSKQNLSCPFHPLISVVNGISSLSTTVQVLGHAVFSGFIDFCQTRSIKLLNADFSLLDRYLNASCQNPLHGVLRSCYFLSTGRFFLFSNLS